MPTVEIVSRWDPSIVLFKHETTPERQAAGLALRDALEAATSSGANLSDADLRSAVLCDADLRSANLCDADLRSANLSDANLLGAVLCDADLLGADLRGADLRGADLLGADLRSAVLCDADLRDADLRGADLRSAVLCDADLRDADLRGADLRSANLSDANLLGADLRAFRDDVWAVLSSAPSEAAAVLAALQAGQVNGNTYSGKCACLVGTIAKARSCDVYALGSLKPDSRRLAEVWFMQIWPGQTPETHEPATFDDPGAADDLIVQAVYAGGVEISELMSEDELNRIGDECIKLIRRGHYRDDSARIERAEYAREAA